MIPVILAALATWRLTSLHCYEDGPLQILERLRQVRGLHDLLSCFWCTSVWAAALFAVLLRQPLADWPATWLGISALAIVIEEGIKLIMGETR